MSIAILPFLAPIALIIASVLAFRGPEFRPAGRCASPRSSRSARWASRSSRAPADPERSGQQRAHRHRRPRPLRPARRGQRGDAGAGDIRGLGRAAFRGDLHGWGGRQGSFTGWLCATLAAVMLLVIAGNTLQLALAWIATSVFLHKLLLFYPERVAAQRAARKKWVTARAGDAALIVAVVILLRPVRHRRHRGDPERGLRRDGAPGATWVAGCSRWPRS
jgi:NAD(P)H-quinone oxidoreductase subunit 5